MKCYMPNVITLTLLASLILSGTTSLQAAEPDWELLFDGKTLNGWIQRNGQAKYHVEAVGNGSDAVEKTITSRPDLLLIKEVLPQMNGHVVASMLRDIPTTSGIPVVLYDDAGFLDSRETDTLHGQGIRHIIHTNSTDDLLAAVKKALHA